MTVPTTTTTAPLASEKQIAFVTSLLKQRKVAIEVGIEIEQALVEGLSMKQASIWIEILLAAPMTPKAIDAQVGPGYYLHDGNPYVVVKSKGGNLYAKRLTLGVDGGKATWVYAPGMISKFTGAPLSLAQAAEWGHAHGHCIKCGAVLTDPKSVTAGIGPVCAKAFG